MTTPLLKITQTMSAEEVQIAWKVYTNQYIKPSKCSTGSMEENQTLIIINRHLDQWKTQPFKDISIFNQVFKTIAKTQARGFFVKALYECMESNTSNLLCIKQYIDRLNDSQINTMLGLIPLTQENNNLFLNVCSKLNKIDTQALDLYTFPAISRLHHFLYGLNKDMPTYKEFSLKSINTLDSITSYLFKPHIISELLTNQNIELKEILLLRYALLLTSEKTNLLSSLLNTEDTSRKDMLYYVNISELIVYIASNIKNSASMSNQLTYNNLISLYEPLQQKFKAKYPEDYSRYILFKSMYINNLDTLISAITSKDIQLNNEEIPFTI